MCSPSAAIQHGRVGVNNATEYQRFFKGTGHPFTSHICRTMKKARKFSGSVSANDSCSLWWVSTHARLRSYFGELGGKGYCNVSL